MNHFIHHSASLFKNPEESRWFCRCRYIYYLAPLNNF